MKSIFLSFLLVFTFYSNGQENYMTITPTTLQIGAQTVPALELIVLEGSGEEACKSFTKSLKKASKQKVETVAEMISVKHATWKKNKIEEPIHIYGNIKKDASGAHVVLAISDTNNVFHDLSTGEMGFRAETYLRRLGIELQISHLESKEKIEGALLKEIDREVNGHKKEVKKVENKIVSAESKIEGYNGDIEIVKAEEARVVEQIKATDRQMTSISLSQKEQLKALRSEKSGLESSLKKARRKTEKLRKNIFKQQSKIEDWKNDIKSIEIQKGLAEEKYKAQKEVFENIENQVDQAELLLKSIK